MRRLVGLAAVFAVVVGVAEAPRAVAQQPAGGVIASGEYANDPALRCDLLEVRRVSGGTLLVRWRIINASAGQAAGLTGTASPKKVTYTFHWDELYYIDPAENKRYQFLTDASNNKILDVFEGELAAGQQRGSWAKFPAPPASSTKISIMIPKFPPFEDIAITQ